MPHIKRADGVQFIIQSYRELLNLKQAPSLKHEVRELARKQGEYICALQRNNEQLEVVFSHEPGFLLGETIWHYFKKPNNLVYCEALPEGGYFLLIVVKGGSIHLDAKVLQGELLEELAALSTADEKYDIYIYGDVPIAEAATESKPEAFILDKKTINSFNVLPDSILPSLLLNNFLRLLPIELVLNTSYFKNKFIRPIMSVIALVIFSSCSYMFFFKGTSEQISAVEEAKEVAKNPYELYNKDLTTPAPERQLRELNKIIGNFVTLAGWELTDLAYQDGTYTAKLKSTVSDADDLLRQWAKTRGFSVSGGGGEDGGATTSTVNISSKISSRVAPTNIYNLDTVVAVLTKKLTSAVAKDNIKLGQANSYPKTKSLELEITFEHYSPLTFDLIGKLLFGFPLRITSINATVTDNLFSGSIKLIIWGN